MRRQFARILVLIASLAWVDRARAIGWDSNDFLIGGGPSFTTRIGVFDHDLTFKGYLDNDFVFNTGMDFDAAGNVVAVGGGNAREVRVYDSSGTRIGGFSNSTHFVAPGDIKVAESGNYIVAMNNAGLGVGAREYTPAGMAVREYIAGPTLGAAVLPGNVLWTGGIESPVINAYDITSGAQIGTITFPGTFGLVSLRYDALNNSVLVAGHGNQVLELRTTGEVIRTFTAPTSDLILSASRGPNGDVYAATGALQQVLRWHADGTLVDAISTSQNIMSTRSIIWAGTIPEPSIGFTLVLLSNCFWRCDRACAVRWHWRGVTR